MTEFDYIVELIYGDRNQSNGVKDLGRFDHAGRWYPYNDEWCPCCNEIRSPSRAHPYSLLRHVKTRRHIREVVARRLGE